MGQFSSLAASSRSSPGSSSPSSGSSSPGASSNTAYSAGARSYSRHAAGGACYRPFSGTGLYAGASPYDPYADPYSGYLRGSADAINSQARMMATEQQSALMVEGVAQARLESRRRTFDQ